MYHYFTIITNKFYTTRFQHSLNICLYVIFISVFNRNHQLKGSFSAKRRPMTAIIRREVRHTVLNSRTKTRQRRILEDQRDPHLEEGYLHCPWFESHRLLWRGVGQTEILVNLRFRNPSSRRALLCMCQRKHRKSRHGSHGTEPPSQEKIRKVTGSWPLTQKIPGTKDNLWR